MVKRFFKIISKLPRIFSSYFLKCSPFDFLGKERIVRVVYSEQNINPRNNKLKSNFFKFKHNPETDRYEMSCIRFEFENLEFCKIFGELNEDSKYERNYYGVACTSFEKVSNLNNFGVVFTPQLKTHPKNYFHCDIYDKAAHPSYEGIANDGNVNLQRDAFTKTWVSYKHTPFLKKENIIYN